MGGSCQSRKQGEYQINQLIPNERLEPHRQNDHPVSNQLAPSEQLEPHE